MKAELLEEGNYTTSKGINLRDASPSDEVRRGEEEARLALCVCRVSPDAHKLRRFLDRERERLPCLFTVAPLSDRN